MRSLLCHMVPPMMYCHRPKGNEANWSQTGTSETVNQTKPFVCKLIILALHYSNAKLTYTKDINLGLSSQGTHIVKQIQRNLEFCYSCSWLRMQSICVTRRPSCQHDSTRNQQGSPTSVSIKRPSWELGAGLGHPKSGGSSIYPKQLNLRFPLSPSRAVLI